MIFNAPHAQIREVQVLFGHQKQQSPAFGSGLPWTLKWYTQNLPYPYLIDREYEYTPKIL